MSTALRVVLDRHGRPLHGAADPLYYQRERERARQGGRELRRIDEAEHAAALAAAGEALAKPPRVKPAARKLKPRRMTKAENALAILSVRPMSAAKLARAIYGVTPGQTDERIWSLLGYLRRQGRVVRSGNGKWHLVREDALGVCPTCGRRVVHDG